MRRKLFFRKRSRRCSLKAMREQTKLVCCFFGSERIITNKTTGQGGFICSFRSEYCFDGAEQQLERTGKQTEKCRNGVRAVFYLDLVAQRFRLHAVGGFSNNAHCVAAFGKAG